MLKVQGKSCLVIWIFFNTCWDLSVALSHSHKTELFEIWLHKWVTKFFIVYQIYFSCLYKQRNNDASRRLSENYIHLDILFFRWCGRIRNSRKTCSESIQKYYCHTGARNGGIRSKIISFTLTRRGKKFKTSHIIVEKICFFSIRKKIYMCVCVCTYFSCSNQLYIWHSWAFST